MFVLNFDKVPTSVFSSFNNVELSLGSRLEGETDSVFPHETSHCHMAFISSYLFPFVPIYYLTKFMFTEVRLANIKAPQMCVTSSDTELRNANINTIYQITIVSHQDKKGMVVVVVNVEQM